MKKPDRPILLTGASGALGRALTRALGAKGWVLRLTDIAPFPDELPAGATFEAADLVDRDAIARMATGCGAILHFGGVSVERPFDEVVGPNVGGLYNVYEAARQAGAGGARVIFASSNHTIGFHERATTIDSESPFRPDGYYGASKVWGEMMGRLYWHKHGIESVCLRIGSCLPKPVDARMLATWLSYPDLVALCERCVMAPKTECAVVWGASRNARMTWWAGDDRERIGWEPQDSADDFTDELAAKLSGDPFVERYQGGAYVAIDRAT